MARVETVVHITAKDVNVVVS